MQPGLVRIAASALTLALLIAPAARGQDAPQPAQNAAPAQIYAPAQLDQLLAPIALYPDQLLGQILMASTYPLEVVQADRWVKDPNNARLRGDQLSAALQPIDWDPSVKSLVPFPQVLAMMDQRLDWTQKLGDAFLAQQADVMDSVQRLRQQAQAAGNLRSTPQETVTPSGQTIFIQPANPEVVYVPVYDPAVVYGTWLYPAYPPIYIPPPPGFYLGPPVYSGIGFSIGFGVVNAFWGWDDWDWDHHRLRVDPDRFNTINRVIIERHEEPRIERDTWEHDPAHRRGVVYRDPVVRDRFRPNPAGPPETRRDFRGFAPQATRPAATAPERAVQPQRVEPQRAQPQRIEPQRVQPQQVQPQREQRAAPTTTVQPQREQRAAPMTTVQPQREQRAAPTTIVQPQREQRAAPTIAARPSFSASRPAATPAPAAVQRTPPPAFQGVDRGGTARQESARGRASIQSQPQRAAPQMAAPPRVAPAPAARSGGGQGGKSAPSGQPGNDNRRHQ
ncbi:MAG TPA: DUF3300 domain-containing protein [Candidatus Cybelea sp.]|nr:DUF3300 domain-containing protein [Candidatus Cybelea sp.]